MAAATGLAAGALRAGPGGGAMPTRELGMTGAKVSILAMGGGSRLLSYNDEQGVAAVKKALDLGITYIDTADDYGNHQSERRIGMALKGRRNGIFLATKLTNRDGAQSFRIVEESLKALQLSQVDLIHIHSLQTPQDLAKIEEKGGVLEQLRKMRDQKMTRFIGITCHYDPTVLKTALERHDFDCTQMALNGALVGMEGNKMVPNRAMTTSFETVALPVANRKKMGVIAMKVFAQEALLPGAPHEKLLYYSMSLPVTTAVVGMPKMEHIEENTRLAKAFQPLPRDEMQRLSDGLSRKYKASLDRFFRDHVDA
ncbi:MAG TPA: aldo/keto reductase [Bryobacteraceae bacterium]|nr:aldo/keto reductase [Bryobacteraceae bacterium]